MPTEFDATTKSKQKTKNEQNKDFVFWVKRNERYASLFENENNVSTKVKLFKN